MRPGEVVESRGQRDDGEPLPVAEDTVSALLTVSRALVALSAQSLVEVEDTLTLSEFRALVALRSHGAERPHGLSTRLGFTAATTARIAERMVELGLVTEDGTEGRLRLSRNGVEVVDAVTSRRRALLTDVVGRMTEDEQRDLVDALLAFARAGGEPIVVFHDESQ